MKIKKHAKRKMKIIVSYDEAVTEIDQQIFDDFVQKNATYDNEVEGIGGGIKNSKP